MLSRSSRYDREFKCVAYLALGVQDAWLVDNEDPSVEVSRARGTSNTVRDAIIWRVSTPELKLPVELNEVFAGLE